MKRIPLSEPMGADHSCCKNDVHCIELVKNADGRNIKFRCPLMIEVEDDIEYAGEWHESCNFLQLNTHATA